MKKVKIADNKYPTEPGLYWARYWSVNASGDNKWTMVFEIFEGTGTDPFVRWRDRSSELSYPGPDKVLIWGPKIEPPPVEGE